MTDQLSVTISRRHGLRVIWNMALVVIEAYLRRDPHVTFYIEAPSDD